MTATISPEAVRDDLIARREIALLDLREESAFARAHPLFAAQLALGRIEVEVLDRIPRRDVPVVVYDDGEGLTRQAAERLAALGYNDVRVLEGGLPANWSRRGAIRARCRRPRCRR